jgi:hypothetical protein
MDFEGWPCWSSFNFVRPTRNGKGCAYVLNVILARDEEEVQREQQTFHCHVSRVCPAWDARFARQTCRVGLSYSQFNIPFYMYMCVVCWGRFRLGSWGPLHFDLQGSGGVIWIINSWLSASLLQSTPTRRFPKVDWEMRYTEFGRIFPNNVSPPSAKQPKMDKEKATSQTV